MLGPTGLKKKKRKRAGTGLGTVLLTDVFTQLVNFEGENCVGRVLLRSSPNFGLTTPRVLPSTSTISVYWHWYHIRVGTSTCETVTNINE